MKLNVLAILILVFVFSSETFAQEDQAPYFASGIKIGEVTSDSAIVWARSTLRETPDFERLEMFTEGLKQNENAKIAMPVDVVPGVESKMRVRYGTKDNEKDWKSTEWFSVDSSSDFIAQIPLTVLEPDQRYSLFVEVNANGKTREIGGSFRTAPLVSDTEPIRFIVTTCQAIRSIDAGAEGHIAYEKMLEFDPHFFVHTGDIIYYDKVPLAKNVAQARAKWNLMFGYGHNRKFHQNVSSYFMKDDHDTLKNDCWPGQTYGELTFDQGLDIFREQVPMGESTYRTFRWGANVQIWLTENRDFRSANNEPDGPEKTILGAEQKAWLMRTISESDALYKFVISPGPLVGPDKKGKADNHSNAAFEHEGSELREFLAKQSDTYVICGDRHWQYCSIDPKTGLLEFGCGPINDQHMFGGNPGEGKHHRYFSAAGGFFAITIEFKGGANRSRAEWFSADERDESGKPKLLHTENMPLDF